MGVANKVQLDSGLAMKLKDAAAACGPHSVPVGSHVGNAQRHALGDADARGASGSDRGYCGLYVAGASVFGRVEHSCTGAIAVGTRVCRHGSTNQYDVGRGLRQTRSLADIGPRLRELEIIPDLVQPYA